MRKINEFIYAQATLQEPTNTRKLHFAYLTFELLGISFVLLNSNGTPVGTMPKDEAYEKLANLGYVWDDSRQGHEFWIIPAWIDENHTTMVFGDGLIIRRMVTDGNENFRRSQTFNPAFVRAMLKTGKWATPSDETRQYWKYYSIER